jgi:hypothetical protein
MITENQHVKKHADKMYLEIEKFLQNNDREELGFNENLFKIIKNRLTEAMDYAYDMGCNQIANSY